MKDFTFVSTHTQPDSREEGIRTEGISLAQAAVTKLHSLGG